MDQEHTPYQAVLRVIGRELDHLHASHIRVLETPTGFSVQFFSNTEDAAITTLTFGLEDLLNRSKAVRFQPLLRHPLNAGKRLKRDKPSYQDFLRALGYELEDAGAYAILVDELDDGYLLTYQFYNPESGFMLHKHRVALQADGAGEIVNVASMRRGRVARKRGA